MKTVTILSIILAFANLANCGVVNDDISVDLTPPVSATYSTGYGISGAEHQTHEAQINHQVFATTGLHEVASTPENGGINAHSGGVALSLETGSAAVSPAIAVNHGLAGSVGTATGINSVLLRPNIGHGFVPVVDAGTTYSHHTHHVAIPVPHPVPVVVHRAIPVPVAVPQPIEVPRPVPVEVPHPVNVIVPKPYPVAVPRPVPVPVKYPVYVKVLKPIPVSVPKPYPVVIPKPVPVPVKVKVPVHHHHDHHFDHHHGPFVIPGGLKGGLSDKLTGGLSGYKSYAGGHGHYISGPNFSGSGTYSNHHHHYDHHYTPPSRYHHHHVDYHDHPHVHSLGQLYDSNGGYKY